MLKAFRKLWNNDRGNVLIMLGATLPLLVGAAGLATDTIEWTLWKRQLQRAADSGAISGVYTRLKTDTEDAVNGSVNTDLGVNNHVGIDLKSGYPVIERLADDGDKKKQVRVTLEITHALPFSSMFMTTAPSIRASATAASVPGADEYCVIALDPSVTVTGIEIAGSTDLDLGECSLIANSKNPNGAASNGASSANGGQGSTVKAKSLAAAGGVQYSSSWDISDYDPNSPPVSDPFSKVPAPKSSDCTKSISGLDKNKAYPMDRTTGADADVAGDVVCITGGVTVQGALKLQEGVTYVLDGGDLVMNSTGSSLNCTHCTIAMTNFATPANTGSIKLTGGTLDISAPTTGTYAGIALYQDRLAKDSGQKTQNQVNGNSGTSVTGIVYIPNQSLLFNGGAGTTAPCLMLVGKRVEFSGSSKMKLISKCPGMGFPPAPSGQRVRLVA